MASYDQEYEEEQYDRPAKKSNNLPIYGNEKTMNLNSLILTNIQSSQYFKVNLYKLKSYHEVLDEIFYQVVHLEPWEKGSRKTSGQTGMCGGVRGVGAGGIVSTAFCILYKLFTLKLTRKQVLGLMNHTDSPYIRGLGFMYIRFTQPPADLWEWFEAYLDDEEEVDVRAGGGQPTTLGSVVRHMLTKLDWYATLFPRIPVPIQKDLEKKLSGRAPMKPQPVCEENVSDFRNERSNGVSKDRKSVDRDRYKRNSRDRERINIRDVDRINIRDGERVNSRDRDRINSRDGDKVNNQDRERRNRDRFNGRDGDRKNDKDRRNSRDRDLYHGRDVKSSKDHRDRRHDRDMSLERDKSRRHDYSSELDREKERIKSRRRSRSHSRNRDSKRRHRH